jgi:hypothetical protein
MWHRVEVVLTDVSEERIAYIFRVEGKNKKIRTRSVRQRRKKQRVFYKTTSQAIVHYSTIKGRLYPWSKLQTKSVQNIYLLVSISLSVYLSIYPCCSHLEKRASVKHFVSLQFLNLRQSVRFLGRVISLTQGRYLHRATQTRINADKHPCVECDSNPRSLFSSARRQFVS